MPVAEFGVLQLDNKYMAKFPQNGIPLLMRYRKI
jgi:hypothetical protein